MSEHHDDTHHGDAHHGHGILPTHVNSTREQLDAMHVPMKSRDLCVDFLVMLHRCRASFGTSPFVCLHEKHQMEQCAYELMKHESQKQFGSH